MEGMPEDGKDQQGGRPNWSRFWLILGGLLLLNWILGSLLMGAVRPAVSYTLFLGQVNANNVQTVTSTGDAIQGTFRHQIAYPPGSSDAGRCSSSPHSARHTPTTTCSASCRPTG
jgi:FtsH-like protein